jgi:hypothetical protein
LGNRLIFYGITPGGGPSGLYSTDGQSLAQINAPPIVGLPNVPSIVEAGDQVYLFAGNASERGYYRTDGVTTELIVTLSSLDSANSDIVAMFELDESLHLAIHDDRVTDDLIFYRTSGETPVEVLRWPVPDDVRTRSSFESQPIFSDGQRAYFVFGGDGGNELYVFDGTSFDQLTNFDSVFVDYTFFAAAGRVFASADFFLTSPSLFEIVGGHLEPLGPGVNNLVEFQGEVFGAGSYPPNSFFPHPLWQIENGQLVSLGDVVTGTIFNSPIRFVEYNGQLYFPGTNGNNRQLYSVVPVPEPSIVVMLLGAVTLCILGASRRNYLGRSCRS